MLEGDVKHLREMTQREQWLAAHNKYPGYGIVDQLKATAISLVGGKTCVGLFV